MSARPAIASRQAASTSSALANFAASAALLLLAGVAGCGPHHEDPDLMEKIRSASARPDSAALTPGVDVRRFYDQLETVSFREGEGGDTFHVLDRRPSIRQFPCSECHAAQGSPKGDRRAHFGIVLQHAPSAVMNCATCHGTAMEADSLTFMGGGRLAFELSHRLCAQCHFDQARDFLGGAHGKRVHGWQGRRVMQSCVTCHDPHAPALPKRWPSTMNTQDKEVE